LGLCHRKRSIIVETRKTLRGGEFIEIIDFETFDQELARIERLDAMIDRTIKRLMQIKTMKQMLDRLEPKLINVAASESRLPQQDLPQKRAS
jgi:hypothetical protein